MFFKKRILNNNKKSLVEKSSFYINISIIFRKKSKLSRFSLQKNCFNNNSYINSNFQ